MISARKPASRHLLDTDAHMCMQVHTCARVYLYESYMGSLPVRRQRDETFRYSRVNEHLKPRARDSMYFQP